jgi:hypothetical protein
MLGLSPFDFACGKSVDYKFTLMSNNSKNIVCYSCCKKQQNVKIDKERGHNPT